MIEGNAQNLKMRAQGQVQGQVQQVRGAVAGVDYNDRVARQAGDARSPAARAEEILKADAEHRSLAADQTLMLKMVMPFARTALRQLAEGCFVWFQHQGFWPNWQSPTYFMGDVTSNSVASAKMKKAEKIALIHSEVSELLEAVRKDDFRNEAEECADILVRLLDYCGACGIDLGEAFTEKMVANYARPFKHGKEF